jgi:hypothetical protein
MFNNQGSLLHIRGNNGNILVSFILKQAIASKVKRTFKHCLVDKLQLIPQLRSPKSNSLVGEHWKENQSFGIEKLSIQFSFGKSKKQ